MTTDEDDRTWSENVVSAIKTRPETPTSSLPWLIWLGSTLVGLLLLALLILLLWMVSFLIFIFKRLVFLILLEFKGSYKMQTRFPKDIASFWMVHCISSGELTFFVRYLKVVRDLN